MTRLQIAVLACLFAALGAVVPARAALLDRVVAVVEDQLVLDSEIAIHDGLTALDLDASPFWLDTHRPMLDRLIDGAVVRVAAADVALYQPPDDAVRDRREAVRARFSDHRAWQAWLTGHGLTEEGLDAVLKRRLVVERYLARNVQVPITDRAAWRAAALEMVDELRLRMRVRTIAEEP